MVLAAILIPVIAVFAGLAWGTAMVYGANQEGRRAADLAALATAAELPLFNLAVDCKVTADKSVTPPEVSTTLPSTTTSTLPSTTLPSTPSTLPGGSTVPTVTTSTLPSVTSTTLPPTPPVTDPLNNPLNIPCAQQAGIPLPPVDGTVTNIPDPSVDLTWGECGIADAQLTNNRSIVTGAYGLSWTCEAKPVFMQPWEQQLANCLADYNATANCAANVQQSVTNNVKSKIPSTPADPLIAQVQALVQAQTGQNVGVCSPGGLPVPASCIGTSDVVTAIQNVQNLVCANVALPATCLKPLIDRLGSASIQMDLRLLAPALLTPAVQVKVHQEVKPPGLSLLGLANQGVTNTSTARRVFKNAVMLPVLGLPDPVSGYSLDPNTDLAKARQPTLDTLRRLNATLTPVLNDAMQAVACPNDHSACGVNDAFGPQIDDLSDIYDPPSGGTGPTASDLLQNAQTQAALVVSPLSSVTLSPNKDDPSKTNVCSTDATGAPDCVTSAAAASLKAALGLSNQIYVPALQFVPVLLTTTQTTVQACPLVIDNAAPTKFADDLPQCAKDFITNASKLHGLFRARLIG